jgi:hypothetical protein
MSLRHMLPSTRAEVRVGKRQLAIEEKEGVAYILIDDEPIEMSLRLRESASSDIGATSVGESAPPYKPAHTFPLDSAPAGTPEIRTFAMGTILVQWELPTGVLRVELSPDFTRADVEVVHA